MTQKTINLIAFVAMVAVNALANILPLGGLTSGGVSDKYPTLFTPAGMTFTIWSVIYVLLGVVLVWSMFDKSPAGTEIVKNVGLLFTLSCVLNIAWIFSWHFKQIVLSTILIFLLLGTLFLIMFRVRTNYLASSAIGLYTGWITVASIAAVYVTAASLGWNGTDAAGAILTGIGLVAGGVIVSAIVFITGNAVFALAAVWAYAGIIYKHITVFNSSHPVIIGLAVAMIVLICFSSGYSMIMNDSIALVRTGKVRIR